MKIDEKSSGNVSGQWREKGKVKKEKVGLMKVRGMMTAAGKHSTTSQCDNEMTDSRNKTLNFSNFRETVEKNVLLVMLLLQLPQFNLAASQRRDVV